MARPKRDGRGKSPSSLANLKRGQNFGNAGGDGGAGPHRARQTKQELIDLVNDSYHAESKLYVSDIVRSNLIADLIDDPETRRWWYEWQHGKPQSKVEMMISNPQWAKALGMALFNAQVDAEKCDLVMEYMLAALASDPE